MVPSFEALTPRPAVGLPRARSGGQNFAHAPVHALFLPESFLKRYRVRPCELTRIFPSLVPRTSTFELFAARAVAGFPCVADNALAPLAAAATASAVSGITAGTARKVVNLLR